jgi:hypothetical protein
VIGILSSEPAGKALEECRKGQAIVTLDAGQEDREIRARFGIVALRRARLLRICVEACEQGIHLSHEDIAYNILNCSPIISLTVHFALWPVMFDIGAKRGSSSPLGVSKRTLGLGFPTR